MVKQHCEHTKSQIVYLKGLKIENFILCKIYLNKKKKQYLCHSEIMWLKEKMCVWGTEFSWSAVSSWLGTGHRRWMAQSECYPVSPGQSCAPQTPFHPLIQHLYASQPLLYLPGGSLWKGLDKSLVPSIGSRIYLCYWISWEFPKSSESAGNGVGLNPRNICVW